MRELNLVYRYISKSLRQCPFYLPKPSYRILHLFLIMELYRQTTRYWHQRGTSKLGDSLPYARERERERDAAIVEER